MPNLASAKIIVWSSPARTILPKLSDRQKVPLSVIACRLSLKATHFECIWGEQGRLVALGCAITKLEAVVWK